MKQIESNLWALTLIILGVMMPSAAWADGDYQLTVVAKPTMAGSFNKSSATLEVGKTIQLVAYANSNFTFVQWTDESGAVVSKQMDFVYTMPSHSSTLTAEYEYNPANPANPVTNYWNKLTGEVIVDDFTTGQLQSAVKTAIDNGKASEVSMITVAGVMNTNDFGILNTYSSCTLLDLSRVAGVIQVPSYAFDNTNLEAVYLPATIESIGTQAFYGCKQLTSMIVYAITPPALGSNVFTNVPDGLVVYVPASAISLYQDAAGWKNFTILPIQEDIRNISVALPDGTSVTDYTNMWLELTNTKSGQRMHYVMTDRQTYTFANIIRNTSWNVTLRNERGDMFGQIDNVEVKDEDVSVTFSALSKPQSVVLSVLTPDGQDVTAQTQVTWTDAQGYYLAQGVSLTGMPTGYQTTYRIVLSHELAMAYNAPQPVDYVLTDGDNCITCRLNAIPQVKISGKVKDASTGLPLSGAVISTSQTFGGKYSKTLNAKTDGNGMFSLNIANVPTSVAFAASDYVSQTVNCDSLLTGVGEVTLPDVSLKAITGAIISIDFTYTTCSAEGEESETQSWYSDYNNVDFVLYNETKQRAISQYNVQYPQIVLLEDVEDGDVLRLTATSRTRAFMPVETMVTIEEQRAEATFAVVELGKIQSSFTSTGNAAVVGSLYDAAGKLLKTYNYSDASLIISDLVDGRYTLVSMGSSRLFNTVYDLAQLPQTGIVEDVDYVQNSVEVKSGAVSAITIDEVPTLDESKLYYTGDNTSFTVNKPSIVAGNYLTLTGRIDFKQDYATSVSNVQMIVDLPESCEFVENSVMVGNSTSSYTLNGNQITIPMARYTDRVRFCIIPTLGGEYAPSAFAQFDLDGETVTQPIGSANYTAKDLSISVPSTVAKTAIPVSGTAIGTSNIEIYDNDVLIGQTTSMANGTWATTCELNEPYNLSRHQIYAKVTTKQGIELTSENASCVYDMNAIQVSVVKMYHDNPELHKTYELTFDFLNPSNKEENYIYYIYNKKFTFTIDFTNNDTTKVSNVVLYVKTAKSGWHPLEATYDAKQDKWVAAGEFGNMYDGDLPVNVSVDFLPQPSYCLDNKQLEELQVDNNDLQVDFQSIESNVQSLLDELATIDSMEGFSKFEEEYFSNIEGTDLTEDLFNITEEITSNYEELEEEINKFLPTSFDIDNLHGFDIVDENGQKYYVAMGDCSGITQSQLHLNGYQSYAIIDSSDSLYVLFADTKIDIVDMQNNIRYTMSTLNITSYLARSYSLQNNISDSFVEEAEKAAKKVQDCCERLNQFTNYVIDGADKVDDYIDYLIRKCQGSIQVNKANIRLLRGKYAVGEDLAKVRKYEEEIAKAQEKITKLGRYSDKVKKFKGTLLTKSASLLTSAYGLHKDIKNWLSLYYRIKDKIPCENNEQKALDLFEEVKYYGAVVFISDALSIFAAVDALYTAGASLIAAPESGGTSVVIGGGIALALGSISLVAGITADCLSEHHYKRLLREVNRLKCDGRSDYDDGHPDDEDGYYYNCGQPSGNKDKKFGIDPSGYVYEGVMTNRVEGVTATIYYKEEVEDMYGDLHENIVKWNAEEYAQENPLFTDENGFYRWDVSQGIWQVKFEKEGYETTYSEWLPVPPPQLDVNIAMKQNRQPEVKAAHAYEDAVEVEFDKYMMPELLNAENIMVIAPSNSPEGGEIAVEGTIELLNEEASYENGNETFASKIRFNATQPFTAQEVTLMVSNRVKSYAGIRMQDDFSQTFKVEQEIKQIVSDSVVTVDYGGTSTLMVSVLPASASKGKTLNIKTSSQMILGVETEDVTINDNGMAEIVVSGELPGTAALTFSVEGTDKTAMTIANVEQKVYTIVATPTANIASGSVVDTGTQIILNCETVGAIIYYTLDGSCPCDNSTSRIIYDGTPIIINEGVTIKVIAVAPNGTESDVAEFIYTTKDEEDAIIQVPTTTTSTKDTYDISGRKVGRKAKGIIIRNNNGTNRKVLVK